jgi:threonine dehydratase
MDASSGPRLEEIQQSAERTKSAVVPTPLVPLHSYSDPSDIYLKPETLQPVGSFKLRGIFNAVACLSEEERSRGVSTVSAGNTAQALAWAARRFGVSARSVMPETAPRTKIDAVRAYGATPVLVPMEEVFRYLREHLWEEEPYAFIHPWTNRDVMTGYGSLGLEIAADAPDASSVFVPVGGGGLIAGVASALKALGSPARVIAVEPEGCPSLYASFEAGRPVSVECRTMCDGVAVPYITEEMYPLLRDVVHDVVLVSDDEVKATIKRLALREKLVVEGAGALSVAAALAIPKEERGKSICVLTGGSIDPEKLAEILGQA